MANVCRRNHEVTAPLNGGHESAAQAARYQAILRQSAGDLLPISDRRDHVPPRVVDPQVDSPISSPAIGEHRGAGASVRGLRLLARRAVVICHWTYERAAL